MLDVLKFIFQDFWHFLGTWILLDAISSFSLIRFVKEKVSK
jgi:hypothetical protein